MRVAGTGLGSVRIDSGDLPVVVAEVRAQLDALGATGTRITVTNDLDEYAIAALRASPVDSFGLGTSVVTGSGHPAAGFVFKLVAHRDRGGDWVGVAKRSAEKADRRREEDPGPGARGRRRRRGDDLRRRADPGAPGRRLLVDYVRDGEALPAPLGADGVSRRA